MLVPLAVVLLAQCWTFGVMVSLGIKFTVVSGALLTVILAIGVADSIHVLAEFFQHTRGGLSREEAADDSRDPASDSDASGAPLAAGVAILAMASAFLFSLKGFLALRAGDGIILSTAFDWIPTGDFTVRWSLMIDQLSSLMTLVVTGVGLLIHIYAAGYMKGDEGYAKFFAYLNLFVAMMLMLVLSDNMVGTFVGWEGVGLCSYLLIGFWYKDGWRAEAAQKAFVVNRIGDAAFLLGMFILATTFGSLDYSAINGEVSLLAQDGLP